MAGTAFRCEVKTICPPLPPAGRCPLFVPPAPLRVTYLGRVVRVVSATGTPCITGVATYTTIQAAIDAADVGDVVAVCPGIYEENLLITGVNKNDLTLVSVVPHGATITAAAGPLLEINDSQNVQVLGFNFTGDLAVGDVIDVIDGASAVIDNNIITATGILSIRVGQVGGPATARITNNQISGYGLGAIVASQTGTTVTVLGNQIAATDLSLSGLQVGVQVGGGATGTIEGNQFSDRTAPTSGTDVLQVILGGVSGVTVARNRIAGGDVGIYLTDNNGIPTTGSTVTCNVLTGLLGSGTGIQLDALTSDNTVADNTVTGWPLLDLTDESTGTLSCCTDNIWLRNKAGTDNKDGCLVASTSATCTP